MTIKTNKMYKNGKDSEGVGKIRKITYKVFLYCVLSVFVFLSCSDNKNVDNGVNVSEEHPLTEEKCINFAEQLHHSFADSNANYIRSYIDWKSIEKVVVKDNGLRQSIFDTLMTKYDIAGDFLQMTYSGADVRFITYYQQEEKHYVIFRVFEQPQSLNIYEFELSGTAEEIQIINIYEYNSAVSISGLLKREVDFWEQWDEGWKDKWSQFNLVQKQFAKHLTDGDLKSAFLLTKQLPEEFQELSRFRQLYGTVCEYSGSADLLASYLQEEVNRIPLTEKGRWLPLFYLRSIEGNYGEALIALSNLEKEVGEDVYIDFLKGNIYLEMADYESAIAYFNKALAVDNQVMIFHLGKVMSFVSSEQYVEAVESLFVMDDYFEISQYDWSVEFAQFPNFIASPEFAEFQERLN